MSDEFVRKDVVDEMRRTYEAQLAACVAEHKAETAALRGAVETLSVHVSGLENLVVVMSEQFRDRKSRKLGYLGLFVTGVGVIFAIVQVLMAVFGKGG